MRSDKASSAGKRLAINTVARRLSHFDGNRLVKEYPVAVGKPSTPTPSGSYKIKNKVVNPGGVLGTRWMGMDIPGGNYGIHGTNNPASIGTAASLGCVRMYNHDVEELFPNIPIGTPVHISGTKTDWSITNKPVPGKRTYTVKSGDTLWQIARNFNISLDELIAANNIGNPDQIHPGQVIIIP
ncbi:L,D-transpeptidase family protein [Desulfotruncus alcoholivorax]|uniref:L,D-transpeptidase family protein n=1 Tax=Desulfotruncus alcoholivorax TaxID=265477 RepID=UPI000406E57A|nr:L,D-transpeptidase family protein [Desulfotruncus alcoholivorax]